MPIPVAPTGEPEIDGILWGWKWDSPHLTVSFPSEIRAYSGYNTVENFSPFTQIEAEQIFDLVLAHLSTFTGLTFTHDPSDGGDLRFAQASGIDYGPEHFVPGLHAPGGIGSAEANPPDPNLIGAHAVGDNWFTTGQYRPSLLGSFHHAAGLLHEVGHALGLKHGHATQTWSHDASVTLPALPAEQDSQEFSVMTYRGYVGGPLNGASGEEEYPWTYMLNDMAALQHMYGANFGGGSNNGDSTYRFDPNTGEMSVDGLGFGAPYGAKILLTIWDGGGEDRYDFSNYDQDQSIDLRPGAFSTFSMPQLANLANGPEEDAKLARGNVANPYLYQGDLRSLIEHVDTGGGNDTIAGNQAGNHIRSGAGHDVLWGGDGEDRLIGASGDDVIDGGTGTDTVNGGDGNDSLIGGPADTDLRDIIFGGAGDDRADGGGGNDLIYGQEGHDTLSGGYGSDELQGQSGNDVISGGALSDLIFGGDGADFVNGGFGHDRINGGNGGDRFFHLGILDHGSDWVQDFNTAEGDALFFGSTATSKDFQVNLAHTATLDGDRAGDDAAREAFVIYRPTGQIIWALIDGEAQASISLQLAGEVFDLLA
ncbi:M10 family metallopeptidase [Lutimaribacter marinistellae]|uniref:M10 family metallopeptidase n=1 Tax=Lutimaribacter marinistellae TaxID=1820329 RepID=A0ABV7TJC8_9RHOB